MEHMARSLQPSCATLCKRACRSVRLADATDACARRRRLSRPNGRAGLGARDSHSDTHSRCVSIAQGQ